MMKLQHRARSPIRKQTETQFNSKCSKITITKADPTSKAKTSKSKNTDDEYSYDLCSIKQALSVIDTQPNSKDKYNPIK